MGLYYPLDFEPVIIRETRATGEVTDLEPTSQWFIWPEEVFAMMDSILEAYELDVEHLFSMIRKVCNGYQRKPWAVIFFREEYPLSGHLMSLRPNPDDIKFSAYSVVRENVFDPDIDGAPPISFIWAFSKEALEIAATTGSPLLSDPWNTLKLCSVEQSWVVIADAIDPSLVAAASHNSDALFFSLR